MTDHQTTHAALEAHRPPRLRRCGRRGRGWATFTGKPENPRLQAAKDESRAIKGEHQ